MRADVVAVGAVALAAGMALAGGWATTRTLEGGSVALTNSQANTEWAPVAVLWAFGAATNATVTVSRVSQGGTYTLGESEVTNAASAVWAPGVDFPFSSGDVLRVECTATNGRVQIIRKGG